MNRFSEYRAAVLRDYQQRKVKSQLSLELIYPTTKSLKEEAVTACHKRFQHSDEKVLVTFFKDQPDPTAYVSAIEEIDVDCFKPIYYFLRGKTTNPEERQVELLAWLTDFKPRPYQEYLKTYPDPIEIDGPDKLTVTTPLAGGDQTGTGPDTTITPPKGKEIGGEELTYPKYAIWLSLSLFLAIVLAVIYLSMIKAKCIRWDGSQYETIACDAFPGDPSVIPYDPIKLNNFKMVLRYDTLTTYSLKKVWYAKRKDEYEFFTAGGTHPIYRDLQLKPLSDFILNTIVRKKKERLLLNAH